MEVGSGAHEPDFVLLTWKPMDFPGHFQGTDKDLE
jgi:hypothetical protein